MINFIAILFIQLFLSSQIQAATTFLESQYQIVHQEGRVHIECIDGSNMSYNSFWCEKSMLTPSDSAHFKTSKKEGLHHVDFIFKNDKGTSNISRRLNPFNGKTLWPVFLWGDPSLLEIGVNTVNYSVENNDDEVLESGVFTTQVIDSPVRKCSPIWIRSVEYMDCQMPTRACQELEYPRRECQ